MKTYLFHGLTASFFAAIAGMVYNYAYEQAMWTDFSMVINPVSIIAAVTFGCMTASIGYFILRKWLKKSADLVFNILFLILSFGSFVNSFAYELPLDVEFPELFPGLSIPLHLFPALFWFATKVLFTYEESI